MSDLIDTTEMYLRTVYEVAEEGIVPMRARIAERLGHSGPTVSQTVARLERDGLVRLDEGRHLSLTTEGCRRATRVMRKHRLAECLLIDVIGLPWERVHIEACRWEHVISEEVERRILELLGDPKLSPFGSPIPAREEIGGSGETPAFLEGVEPLAGKRAPGAVKVVRLGEAIQTDEETLRLLADVGARPGGQVDAKKQPDGWILRSTPASGNPRSAGTLAIHLSSAHAASLFIAKE